MKGDLYVCTEDEDLLWEIHIQLEWTQLLEQYASHDTFRRLKQILKVKTQATSVFYGISLTDHVLIFATEPLKQHVLCHGALEIVVFIILLLLLLQVPVNINTLYIE